MLGSHFPLVFIEIRLGAISVPRKCEFASRFCIIDLIITVELPAKRLTMPAANYVFFEHMQREKIESVIDRKELRYV